MVDMVRIGNNVRFCMPGSREYVIYEEQKPRAAYTSGPSCSKLTTSLVNDSLKFTSSDTQICWNFLLKKLLTFFFSKNIRVLYIESAKTVKEITLNELVQLTTLWTTGPSIVFAIVLSLSSVLASASTNVSFALRCLRSFILLSLTIKSLLFYFLAPSPNLIVILAEQAHNIKMTSYQRRCDVITSHRRWYDIILPLCAHWEAFHGKVLY